MNEHVKITNVDRHGYEADFYAWTEAQAKALRERRLGQVDLENVAEEIEDLGKNLRSSVISYFAIALEHLLKLKFSADQPPRRGWKISTANARNQIESICEQSPSLAARRLEFFEAAWRYAIRSAAAGVDAYEVPPIKAAGESHVFTLEQVLDPDFFPGD